MIYMFIADGFEEVEALCPLDLLRRAGQEVRTVGVGGKTITGAHGITVTADMTEDELAASPSLSPDMVILPGGMPGTQNLADSSVVRGTVATAYAQGAFLAAICAAPMILGQLSLLDGKSATCFPGFEQYLTGANVCTDSVVRDGHLITARGMGVALDFGLALVDALCGSDCAQNLRAAVMAG